MEIKCSDVIFHKGFRKFRFPWSKISIWHAFHYSFTYVASYNQFLFCIKFILLKNMRNPMPFYLTCTPESHGDGREVQHFAPLYADAHIGQSNVSPALHELPHQASPGPVDEGPKAPATHIVEGVPADMGYQCRGEGNSKGEMISIPVFIYFYIFYI